MGKVSYYLDLFKKKGITEETAKEFEEDRSDCIYQHSMPCPLCSASCFKHKVYIMLYMNKSDDSFRKLTDLQMKLYS